MQANSLLSSNISLSIIVSTHAVYDIAHSLIASVAAAMGLLLGLLGCCGIMLFISIMAGMKAVSL